MSVYIDAHVRYLEKMSIEFIHIDESFDSKNECNYLPDIECGEQQEE